MFHVQPIYGNGWTVDYTDIPEPAPFRVDGCRDAQGAISGKVILPEHEFLGASFEAKLRHVIDDSLYNCRIKLPEGRVIRGYCKIMFD